MKQAKYFLLLLFIQIFLVLQLSQITQATKVVTKKISQTKDKREVDRFDAKKRRDNDSEDEDEDKDSEDDTEEEEITVQIVKSSSKDIYELRMRKYPSIITFNAGQVISKPSSNCDKAHTGFFHNTTWSTSFCIIQDIAYNVEVTVGNPKYKNFELFNMMVDINQPWTWIKSRTCKSCKSLSTYSQGSLENATCSNSCLSNVKYDLLKSRVKPGYQGKQASITGYEQGVFGGFFYDQLSFLAYQPNQNITLGAILKEKLSPIKFNSLEDFFTISQIKMISAEKIVNYGSFNASGVLGLAHTDTEFDLPNIEEETSFMNQLISEEESKLEDEDNIFGVYLNSFSKEYALTLGGYNGEYSPELTLSEYWIDLKQNKKKSNYQYTVGVSSLRTSSVTYTTQTTTEAILTLSSTFISVPWDVLKRMINDWNNKYSMDCSIIDNHYQVVFCQRVVPRELEDVHLEFEFSGGVQYKISMESVLRECSHDKKSLFNQDIQRSVANECILSINVSQDSKRFILGNVFLDKHYTLFDLKNNRIAFLPPTERSFFADEDDKRQYVELIVTIVAIVFVIGMAILFCQQRILACFRGTLVVISMVVDWQKIVPKRKKQDKRNEVNNKSLQFQQLPEHELDVTDNNINGKTQRNQSQQQQQSSGQELQIQQTQDQQQQQQGGRKKIFIVNKANPAGQQQQIQYNPADESEDNQERKAAMVALDLI